MVDTICSARNTVEMVEMSSRILSAREDNTFDIPPEKTTNAKNAKILISSSGATLELFMLRGCL